MPLAEMPTDRPIQFKMMLSAEEKAWLEEVAAARGLTASDVLRLYIREARASLAAARADIPAVLRDALASELQKRGFTEAGARRAVDDFAKGGELPTRPKATKAKR